MSAFSKSDILLPNDDINLGKWAVVACDQFTSEPQYWQELAAYVGNEPSMLNLVFPEVYLSQNNEKRISQINSNMGEYIRNDVYKKPLSGFVLTVRSTPHAACRVGLVGKVDLDSYSFVPGNSALIRATEGIILDRIPPRVKIRENSPVESPHIMLLIDDRKMSVIKPFFEKRNMLEKIYDFDLNMNGGHIEGYYVSDETAVARALDSLIDEKVLLEKYGQSSPFLFAVGDGNHSLATAKACWENIKKSLPKEQQDAHPAKYALVEIVNIFDEGLSFEPIHRVVFGASPQFVLELEKIFTGKGTGELVYDDCEKTIALPEMAADSVKLVQDYIDHAIANKLCESVDYVHGKESVKAVVAAHKNSIGIILNAMDKSHLFLSVLKNGVLPRKTFSMGEAIEKRYYLECRRIQPV